MTSINSIKICFVCLGNICRSPLAQGIFEALIIKENCQDLVYVESAGTGSWHIGKPPDSRMQSTARKNNVDLNSLARQFQPEDYHRFDLVFAMDQANFIDLASLSSSKIVKKKLRLFRSFDPENLSKLPLDVPDPYYGGNNGFDNVFNIIHRTSPKILEFIKTTYLNF